MDSHNYAIFIGLEVHCQLSTNTKLFCRDAVAFGVKPNSSISEVSLAYPGTLPMINSVAVEMAVKMGLASNCKINKVSCFERKHYNYPDLPKGYQLTQNNNPICIGGFIPIRAGEKEKTISLHHIHLEEDAGKSIHNMLENYSCVDYNRAGIPLLEIVTNPDIKNAEEATAFVDSVRKIIRYLKISDGNLEEGNLRCDVNISVKYLDEATMGTKVEIKNLNSLRNIRKAIEFETQRLIHQKRNKEIIKQETRAYNPSTETTFILRNKEFADDYRYFEDPDLPKLKISDEFIDSIRTKLPTLHNVKEDNLIKIHKIKIDSALKICENLDTVEYFENIVNNTTNVKAAVNWILGPIKNYLNYNQKEIDSFPIAPKKIAEIINLIEKNDISYTDASTILFEELTKNPSYEIKNLVERLGILQDNSSNSIDVELEVVVKSILDKFPEKVKQYKFDGKKGLLAFFIGETIKNLSIKLNPQKISEKIKGVLDEKC